MNLQGLKLSEQIKFFAKEIHSRDLDAFFQSLKDQELSCVEAAEDSELPMIKARVKVIGELRFLFSEIRNLKLES